MTDGPDPVEPQANPSPPRSARRRLTFVMLAGVLAIVGALVAGYYFAMRPVTLRIAVGPANSDDLRVVQALAQALNNQQRGQVRLRPMLTEGALASANLLGEGKADLAIIRGDLDVPKNAQAVATLRKNVAVLWVPAGKVKGKKAAPKITKIAQLAGHRIGVVGRTQANVNLLKVILQQYAIDPGKVEIIQFPANEAAEAIRNQRADAYLAAGPVNSKITADAIAASMHDGGTPRFLAIDTAAAIDGGGVRRAPFVTYCCGESAGLLGAALDGAARRERALTLLARRRRVHGRPDRRPAVQARRAGLGSRRRRSEASKGLHVDRIDTKRGRPTQSREGVSQGRSPGQVATVAGASAKSRPHSVVARQRAATGRYRSGQ